MEWLCQLLVAMFTLKSWELLHCVISLHVGEWCHCGGRPAVWSVHFQFASVLVCSVGVWECGGEGVCVGGGGWRG